MLLIFVLRVCLFSEIQIRPGRNDRDPEEYFPCWQRCRTWRCGLCDRKLSQDLSGTNDNLLYGQSMALPGRARDAWYDIS